MTIEPTSEQQAVIEHPVGKHARVLSVAGSGKTTTMALRIKRLVDSGVKPSRIQAVMFNRLARKDFRKRLDTLGPSVAGVRVDSFHSCSYKIVQEAVKLGLRPAVEVWAADKTENIRRLLHDVRTSMAREGTIQDPEEIDIGEALTAIGLWKGALIPPERAGHRRNPLLPLVYERFEELRLTSRKLTIATFDDFVPMAVQLLEANANSLRRFTRLDHVIADEYQDVNLGQQRLIELLAGPQADIMVVGDDDQTIFEWRGARPNFIISDFERTFPNKAHVTYQLTHSFRFGPVIAQAAQNVIRRNTKRTVKRLIAHDASKDSRIHLVQESSEQPIDVHKELVNRIVTLVQREGVLPSEIWCLTRMYAQLSGLEAQLLRRKVPYRVLGRAPFFERGEIKQLVNYLRLAMAWSAPLSQESVDRCMGVLNFPNRKISRKVVQKQLQNGLRKRATLATVLAELYGPEAPLPSRTRASVQDFSDAIEVAAERVHSQDPAGGVVGVLVEAIDLDSHFDNYYGKGEASLERKETVRQFVSFAGGTGMDTPSFLTYLSTLDPTLKTKEKDQLTLTTVFKTKGLEFDYVVIPDCVEGYMPCHAWEDLEIYDTSGKQVLEGLSPPPEDERRLFYVAITRARKDVLIGTSKSPTEGALTQEGPMPSRFIEEANLGVIRDLVEPVDDFARGDMDGVAEWLAQVRVHAAQHDVLENLQIYLAALELEELREQVSKIAATSTSTPPESYSLAYPVMGSRCRVCAGPLEPGAATEVCASCPPQEPALGGAEGGDEDSGEQENPWADVD
jgi:DNA helicase-2/ATP-dependent DNA helicase PcrA